MSGFAYVLPAPPVLRHGLEFDIPQWLADGDFAGKGNRRFTREFTAEDVMAASGDCFVTIATRLDKIAQSLPPDSAGQIEIEHIVRSLLYLQTHYAVVSKRKLGR